MKTPTEIHAEVGQHIQVYHDIGLTEFRAFTVSDIAKIIKDAKAEEKGVCEWRNISPLKLVAVTSCGSQFVPDYQFQFLKFCPGCGKEIKVV